MTDPMLGHTKWRSVIIVNEWRCDWIDKMFVELRRLQRGDRMTTIFEREILSQGEILRQRSDHGARQAEFAAGLWRGRITHVIVAARGSSDNAATLFQYLAGNELGLLVALATPSLYRERCTISMKGAGVLGISQSGQSPDIVQVLHHAGREGCPRVAITNDVTSPLALEAEAVLDLLAGEEESVAATKTFSSTWHALAQLVEAMKGSPLAGLDSLPGVLDVVAPWALSQLIPEQLLGAQQGLTVVGRGVGYASATEISLKIREVAGIRSESYAAPDILHGPIGANGQGATLLMILTDEVTDEDASYLLVMAKDSGLSTVVLRPEFRKPLMADGELVVPVTTSNWAFGLAAVVVGQVVALRLGESLKRPIDNPPGLRKVTRTS
jgi:glucosamine--fructose-6-phosphate aminotransferase (isomerizing)